MAHLPQIRIAGMMRVKNESRWIEESVKSLAAICYCVYILDDHSTDGTQEKIIRVGTEIKNACRVFLVRSPFHGWDESRDKNFLLGHVLYGNPDWVLCVDGDEVITQPLLLASTAVTAPSNVQALSVRIQYLWNDNKHIRVDGPYGNFWRSSMFRVAGLERGFSSSKLGGGRNLHIGNAPHGLHVEKSAVYVKHYGYMFAEDREKKRLLYGSAMYPRLDGEPELQEWEWVD